MSTTWLDTHFALVAAIAKIELLEARILELEQQLAQPKHQRWQAPINQDTP